MDESAYVNAKYINTEQYCEHEYQITKSHLLPRVEGYIGNLTVFSDAEHPDKSFVVYRAKWDSGEVSDAFKDACMSAINLIDSP